MPRALVSGILQGVLQAGKSSLIRIRRRSHLCHCKRRSGQTMTAAPLVR